MRRYQSPDLFLCNAVPTGINRTLSGTVHQSSRVLACLRHRLTPPNGTRGSANMSSELKGATMGTTRYVVSVNVIVEATSEDEASMMVERTLAGHFDNDIVDVFAEYPDKR